MQHSVLLANGDIGRTYRAEELLTYLFMENQHLKGRIGQTFTSAPIAPPATSDLQAKMEYDVLRAYLRTTSATSQTGRPRHLVIANDYPKRGHEYGNGFIHQRVKKYQEYGSAVDVMAFGKRLSRGIYRYQGVDVLSGYVHELAGLLASKTYDSVSIHFMNSEMWNVVHSHFETTDFYVFIHGYEARRWIRQPYEHANIKSIQQSIDRTLILQSFWQHVSASDIGPKKFIFVSDFWRKAVSDDMEIVFPPNLQEVIHNVIDTKLFSYEPKPVDQRLRILWLRSASARNYGNDIAIECLKLLRQTHYWNDLDIRIIGDGKYFVEFEKEFERESNVTIERSYKTHEQISKLHKDYGIFLVPTRLDSQGVSRDEAMSSGLVPVTNSVAAVPEFTDEGCAILAPAEGAHEMAAGIIALIEDPERFLQMSKAASERVRAQSSEWLTVQREAQIMGLSTLGIS